MNCYFSQIRFSLTLVQRKLPAGIGDGTNHHWLAQFEDQGEQKTKVPRVIGDAPYRLGL
jgi:hypothetical protein